MRLDEFDYDLPERLIALRPAKPRRAARLLRVRPSALDDHHVADLPSLLRPGDLMVFNDTKVIPARLFGLRRRSSPHGSGEAKIEAMLTRRLDADQWLALARPAKRLAVGDRIQFGEPGALTGLVRAKGEGGVVTLAFDHAGAALDAAIAAIGVTPLPPYIASKRAADDADVADYQTVFAAAPGAVAAPTAALHFDETLLGALDAAGIERVTVTLHVGAGTFLPVTADDVEAHSMHAETGEIGAATAARLAAAKEEGRRIVAVGTTAARLLETAALAGPIAPWRGETDLFILPGHAFRAIDALITNFHLPKSTLVMLVSALMGRERMLSAYAHAVHENYRFYSYGDATLLEP